MRPRFFYPAKLGHGHKFTVWLHSRFTTNTVSLPCGKQYCRPSANKLDCIRLRHRLGVHRLILCRPLRCWSMQPRVWWHRYCERHIRYYMMAPPAQAVSRAIGDGPWPCQYRITTVLPSTPHAGPIACDSYARNPMLTHTQLCEPILCARDPCEDIRPRGPMDNASAHGAGDCRF